MPRGVGPNILILLNKGDSNDWYFYVPRNAFLGFDHLFDELERVTNHAKDSYPPHNVVKYDDMKYDIELAIAGFSKDDISIELKEHVLSLSLIHI